MAANKYDPKKDGIEHINVSIHGKTELGRLLSMEFPRPFIEPVSGKTFTSLYQYWIWLNSGKNDSILKKSGWKHSPDLMTSSMFGFKELPGSKTELMKCIKETIGSNAGIVQRINNTELPFVEYHVMEPAKGEPITIDCTRPWYINAITNL